METYYLGNNGRITFIIENEDSGSPASNKNNTENSPSKTGDYFPILILVLLAAIALIITIKYYRKGSRQL